MVQEIKITASITLEVDASLSKEELVKVFSGVDIGIVDRKHNYYESNLEIIEIEEEADIYGTEHEVL